MHERQADMLLNDAALLTRGPALITPFDPKRVQPASVDLTLGLEFLEPIKQIRPASLAELPRWRRYGAWTWTIAPGAFFLASTVETLHVPADLVAQVSGKSSWARLGLIVHGVAGFVDCGFDGQITLELFNAGPWALRLDAGVAICQVSFSQMCAPAVRPYGSEGVGHYQGQRGPRGAVGVGV